MIAFLDLIEEKQDKNRFEELYYAYKDLMYSVAYSLVKNAESAEDCVQEAFLYIAKHFDRIDDIRSNRTRNYVATIVRGLAMKQFNKSAKISTFEETDFQQEPASVQNLEEDYLTKCKVEQLRSAINQLDEIYRIPLYMKAIYDMKSSEIAKLLGVSDDTVRRRIYLARKKIKEIMEKEEPKNE